MGEAKQKEDLKQRAAAELAQWGETPVLLQMSISEIMVVTGALQLALRHPGFDVMPSAKVVRNVVQQIAGRVPAQYPAIAQMIRLGFYPRV